MVAEPPPKWAVCVLIIFLIIFAIPTAALAIVLGIVFYPLAYCCGCCVPQAETDINPNRKPKIHEVIGGCWFLWLFFCLILVVFIPVCLVACLYQLVANIWSNTTI